MKNQNLPSFSTHKDGTQEFNFKAPSSWAELSEEQLRYVLSVMSIHHDHIVIKCYLLARFCGLTVHKYTRTGWNAALNAVKATKMAILRLGKCARESYTSVLQKSSLCSKTSISSTNLPIFGLCREQVTFY